MVRDFPGILCYIAFERPLIAICYLLYKLHNLSAITIPVYTADMSDRTQESRS